MSSIARIGLSLLLIVACTNCEDFENQTKELHELQLQSNNNNIRNKRPFGAERLTRLQKFNITHVLEPGYQVPVTLWPGNVSRLGLKHCYHSPFELVVKRMKRKRIHVRYPLKEIQLTHAKDRFYYLNPQDGPPLTVLVSPCSGPISWSISFVESPKNVHENEAITQWPVKNLDPGPILFTYKGMEDQNFTIPESRAGLYCFKITPLISDKYSKDSSTVLLYATSNDLDYVPGPYLNDKKNRHHSIRFQLQRNKRRLTVSWNRSHIDPHLSKYCLAVTSGSQLHPATLCYSMNTLKITTFVPKTNNVNGRANSWESQHYYGTPQGLYCLRKTKITLHGMIYDTLYKFTLYVVNMRSNVSSRVATNEITFQTVPIINLYLGRYATSNLHKSGGTVNFRYTSRENTSNVFHIFPCGEGSVRAKLSGPTFAQEKEVAGYASLKTPMSTSKNNMYTLQISTIPQEVARVTFIRVLVGEGPSSVYPKIPSRSIPREYRSLRTCNEITVGVESAGTAKYCILVRELRSPASLSSVTTIPDQCGIHRRRRSEYTFEVCEEKRSPSKKRALPFTLKKLQPGKAYLLQITAQLKDRLLSYPLLGVRTRRSCSTK